MSEMTPDRLRELRRIAEAATPGPWAVNPFRATVDEMPSMLPICGLLWPTEERTEEQTFANAKYIAEFNPTTALAILDEIERLQKERENIVGNVTRFVLYDPDLNWWECQACRLLWEFESGDPYEHDMRFCPRCGRWIMREAQQKEALYGGEE